MLAILFKGNIFENLTRKTFVKTNYSSFVEILPYMNKQNDYAAKQGNSEKKLKKNFSFKGQHEMVFAWNGNNKI